MKSNARQHRLNCIPSLPSGTSCNGLYQNVSRTSAALKKMVFKDQPNYFQKFSIQEKQLAGNFKQTITIPPIPALLQPTNYLGWNIDSCNIQSGCALLQPHPGKPDKPSGYSSRALSNGEEELTTTGKECLAVVCTVLLLLPYVEKI